jgi:hypothetical protein
LNQYKNRATQAERFAFFGKNDPVRRRIFKQGYRMVPADAYELFSMIESVTMIGVSLCMDMPS